MRGAVTTLATVATLALLGAGAGCSGPTADDGTTLTVLAAASLQEPFAELGRRFEERREKVSVRFSFAGSSDLVAQLQQGAPADVLATADEQTMGRALEDGLVAGAPRPFATNRLTIAVLAGNPAKVQSLADLAGDDLAVVVCAPAVPCGSATTRVVEAAGVPVAPVSEEASVSDVLNKVVTGQADAGVVYETDVLRSGGRVEAVALPQGAPATNVYPVAALTSAEQPELARAFVELVTGEAGQAALAEAGFGVPDEAAP